MEIKNFTDTSIRVGEFPSSLDIRAIPGNHSDHGFMAFFFSHRLDNEKHFMQIRKRKDIKDGLVLFIFKWERQLDDIPEFAGDVVFDSRDITQNNQGDNDE